jgi:hypothetical protein
VNLPVRVLAIDPGRTEGVTAGSGWCYQDPNEVFKMGSTKDLEKLLIDWNLTDDPIDVLVVEEYRIIPQTINQNIGIKQVTVQNIGAAKLWARMNKIRVVEYLPTLKPTQCKATGVTPKKMQKIKEHEWDAYNHGRYFLIQSGLAPSALELEMIKKGLLK